MDRQQLGKLLGKIGSIGNNINQLAKVANAGSWPESQQLQSACDDIQWMRQTLMLALGTDPKKEVRTTLKQAQEKRWQAEELKRAKRLRKGLMGLWDRLTGKRGKISRQNKQEAEEGLKRDKNQNKTLSTGK